MTIRFMTFILELGLRPAISDRWQDAVLDREPLIGAGGGPRSQDRGLELRRVRVGRPISAEVGRAVQRWQEPHLNQGGQYGRGWRDGIRDARHVAAKSGRVAVHVARLAAAVT